MEAADERSQPPRTVSRSGRHRAKKISLGKRCVLLPRSAPRQGDPAIFLAMAPMQAWTTPFSYDPFCRGRRCTVGTDTGRGDSDTARGEERLVRASLRGPGIEDCTYQKRIIILDFSR